VIETQPDPLRYINLICASHEVILAENIACAALCFQAYDPAYKGQITDDAATLPTPNSRGARFAGGLF
jgi:hypothetical protein